jgi:hypothetical protein
VRNVKRPAAAAPLGLPAGGQLFVDAKQYRKKSLILKQKMAHLNGLFSWRKRDSPDGIV